MSEVEARMEELVNKITPGKRSHCLSWALASSLILLQTANARPEEVIVHNRLSACTALEQMGTSTESNLLIVDANLLVKKPTSECGCFSASVTYTSYLTQRGSKDILQLGQINVLRPGAKKIVLSSDAVGVSGHPLNLDLACTPPL